VSADNDEHKLGLIEEQAAPEENPDAQGSLTPMKKRGRTLKGAGHTEGASEELVERSRGRPRKSRNPIYPEKTEEWESSEEELVKLDIADVEVRQEERLSSMVKTAEQEHLGQLLNVNQNFCWSALDPSDVNRNSLCKRM
jgi:hypothetical protein